jgi:hypothetical protein
MNSFLKRRLDRRYERLCFIQKELGGLDFNKPGKAASFEDFVLGQTDFSRYKEIRTCDFEFFTTEGLSDFEEVFFLKYFSITRDETLSLVERSYRQEPSLYRLIEENPLILSVMRTIQASLELGPLIRPEEIPGITGGLFRSLICKLDNTIITHDDGMTTKLFLSPAGDLSGTFRPGNKPWTLVLIPAEKIL